MLVLQICSISLHILPVSSRDTNATLAGCAHDVGNMKVEEDFDMEVEEEKVNVKTEKGVGSEEEECTGIKDEGMYSEAEVKEEHIDIKEKENIDLKEEDYVRIKGEVSLEGTV